MALTIHILLLLTVTLTPWNGSAQRKLIVTGFPFTDSTRVVLIDSTDLVDASPAFDRHTSVIYYLKKTQAGFAVMSFDYLSGSRRNVYQESGSAVAVRPVPTGAFLSCVFRNHNGETILVRFSKEGIVLETRKLPFVIENFIWIDDNNLLLIEEGKPNTLLLYSLRPEKKIPVAKHVGKALSSSGKSDSFAFVHKLSVDSWSIKTIRQDGSIDILAETLPEAAIFTLTPDGNPVLYSDGDLHRYHPGSKSWKVLTENPVTGDVHFMQVSPAADKLALLVGNLHVKTHYGN